MYKDPEKQKEANKLASQRKRDKAKGMTNGGMTPPSSQGMTEGIHPEVEEALMDAVIGPTIHYSGGPDCGCQMCKNYRAKGKSTEFLNHGPPMWRHELAATHPDARNRVPLPGDKDYDGVALRIPGAENLKPAPAKAVAV